MFVVNNEWKDFKMANKSTRFLTEAQFEACMPYLRGISEKRVQLAYKAMVERLPISTLAEEVGNSKSAVSAIVTIVWKHHEFLQSKKTTTTAPVSSINLPEGWEQSTFVGPASIMLELKNNFEEHMRNFNSTHS